MDINSFDLISIEDAMHARYWDKTGKNVVSIYVEYYWLVYDGDKLLIHKKYKSCMCNQTEKIVANFKDRFTDSNFHIRKLSVVFIPYGC